MSEPTKPDDAVPLSEKDQLKVVQASDLFDGGREVLILHEGEQYRLRLTRRNKLILQK